MQFMSWGMQMSGMPLASRAHSLKSPATKIVMYFLNGHIPVLGGLYHWSPSECRHEHHPVLEVDTFQSGSYSVVPLRVKKPVSIKPSAAFTISRGDGAPVGMGRQQAV